MEYFEQFGSSENSGEFNQGYRDRFEVEKIDRRMERNTNSTKTKCRYAKNKNGDMGIMPMILSKLLKQRTSIKKLMGIESPLTVPKFC